MKAKKQSSLARILGYAGGHKKLTILGCILSALSAVLGLAPYLCVWLVARSVLFKELLLPPEQMGRGLAVLEPLLPGRRCYVRTPAGWEGMPGSYLQPFAMLKWYDPEKEARWGEDTHGYMGLGFD